MDSPAFTRWRAFRKLYPPLEDRLDLAATMIVLAVRGAEVNPFEKLDFAAPYRDEQEEEDQRNANVACTLNAVFSGIAARFKAKADRNAE